MDEQLIMKFKLPYLEQLSFIEHIVQIGYRKTGRKFYVIFSGSKGYLDNIEIRAECLHQTPAVNRIDLFGLRTKKGRLRSISVSLFYNVYMGVKVIIHCAPTYVVDGWRTIIVNAPGWEEEMEKGLAELANAEEGQRS